MGVDYALIATRKTPVVVMVYPWIMLVMPDGGFMLMHHAMVGLSRLVHGVAGVAKFKKFHCVSENGTVGGRLKRTVPI